MSNEPTREQPETRMYLCDGCGAFVPADKSYGRVESRGSVTKACYYCKRCARDRGLTPGSFKITL